MIRSIVLVLTACALFGCARYPSKSMLMARVRQLEPDVVLLERGYNPFVSRAFTEDGLEYGKIVLGDQTVAKYWFISHHLVSDMGGTWFQLPNGKFMYMAGWFCCEAQFPDEGFRDAGVLVKFIRTHHGVGI